ncbi:LiaI-LiaF-like domain-containing protein [Peribacillus glennii]|uniref:LiaI-LiaF-like transmembrane region domain-containing protein n=1 Tax=Peribacillus glennii TaxID=2303991 RepID=A0A372LHY6_9BACI|nr:DUF5668 domain-containing protein [Peribacillus glennii]RFU65901.1 hypothetical protein D0466_08555 [Peribacillus glennii]
MKAQRIFPGTILIGFGLYFFLEESRIEIFSGFYTWPTLLCIVGLAFLSQAYGGNDHEAILPGVILFGFGLHFHIVNKYRIWPDNVGIFILIISLGFILRAKKTNSGMIQGILLLVIAISSLFYDKVISWLGFLETGVTTGLKLWPALLVAAGLYFLFIKKK